MSADPGLSCRRPARRGARLAAMLLASGAFVAAATGQTQRADPAPVSTSTPRALRGVGIDQKLGAQIPLDLLFQDEGGRPVRLRQYFGDRPVVLVLAYYNCPMLCTQVLNGLVSSMRALSFDAGKEFEVVTVSFDPHDRPADAAAKKVPYIREYGRPGAAQGWHFLTGGPGSIDRLAQAVGFRYSWDNDLAQFAHASAIFVLTPDGKLSRYFFGIEYAPRDLRLGLIEASNRRIGNPVDALLLYCYHYDPKVGKYGAVVMNLVRLAGVGAVLILSTFVTLMWRRDRRRDAARMKSAGGGPEAPGDHMHTHTRTRPRGAH
ncbi:MAG: SCO family protein [Acidobacteriota bacterium]